MHAVAIVPAAGEGWRLREVGGPAKQFRELGGRPLLVWALRALSAHDWVRKLIVAVPADAVDEASERLRESVGRAAIEVVAGGSTRQQSVRNALDIVESRVLVTHLRTPTNEEVVIPNSHITGASVVLRRIDHRAWGHDAPSSTTQGFMIGGNRFQAITEVAVTTRRRA
jgi:NDP-sugar pyrophosphorylase family protein